MSWSFKYAILLLTITIISFILAKLIDREKNNSHKKRYLCLSLFLNLGILFMFKYFNFFNDIFSLVLTKMNIPQVVPNFKLLMPLGISFYTFQITGYMIDVYKGRIKAERNFGVFALFVSFFPQIVAGPIQRGNEFLYQFYQKRQLDLVKIKEGLILILWGLFKKIAISDKLGIYVNKIYNNPYDYSGIILIIATLLFSIQLYCDFSGYSDIAIGYAKILGFQLKTNFDRPYFAKSIQEFWRRWHISLSTWFRDYLYIPLGGNRVSRIRSYLNIFVVFLLSGLWHGANWTYVVWGAIHGLYLIIYQSFKKADGGYTVKKMQPLKFQKLKDFICIVVTFSIVTFAWIFFRANKISDAIYIVKNLFTDVGHIFDIHYVGKLLIEIGLTKYDCILMFIPVLILFMIQIGQKENTVPEFITNKPLIIRWSIYYLLIFSIILLGGYGNAESTQFIYSQF
ncbi:MBOAT family O-acyltransferase [Fervidicella metallireducens]|nr:MBOAT family O-acyltransferase [Fervidicella metallireducens]